MIDPDMKVMSIIEFLRQKWVQDLPDLYQAVYDIANQDSYERLSKDEVCLRTGIIIGVMQGMFEIMQKKQGLVKIEVNEIPEVKN